MSKFPLETNLCSERMQSDLKLKIMASVALKLCTPGASLLSCHFRLCQEHLSDDTRNSA